MLAELAVHNLGVIADLRLVLGPGMTAITGETGAGKTLVVEAIELLVGGRAESHLVRPGAEEASVEGRFLVESEPKSSESPSSNDNIDDELVLARVVPRTGRSRAYVDGRLAPVAALVERGALLVDLHGQHAHQSLLSGSVQRAALDRFGRIDVSPLVAARRRLATIEASLAAVGGDAQSRAREIELLRFQLTELDDAQLCDPDEDAALEAEEDVLANAAAHREAIAIAHRALAGEGGTNDAVGVATSALAGRAGFADVEARLRMVAAELTDLVADLRVRSETLDDDPVRLEAIRARRRRLREFQRKYGVSDLAELIDVAAAARTRLNELSSHETRATELEAERAAAQAEVVLQATKVRQARQKAAVALGEAVEVHLYQLALPRARFCVTVEDEGPGDEVVFSFCANPGEALLPLAKVASGGELARVMLAARLVLTESPPTLVFDEVDAGIGGQASVAVGRSLAALADRSQVLVVTHLAQVAAFADQQVVVAKQEADGRTVASARLVEGPDRIVELSRMLSGQPDSVVARRHAAELLATAATAKDTWETVSSSPALEAQR